MPSVVPVYLVLLLAITNVITANSDCMSIPCLCCKSGECSTTNQGNSKCDACRDGFTGPSCYEPCPADCFNCSQKFYSETNPDPVCYVCKKGFFNGQYNDMKSLPLQEDCSLQCKENCDSCSSFSDCHLCKIGFFLDNEYQCEKCPEHCDRCNSRTDCFACENGYGWTGEFCWQCKPGCNRCKPESFDDCSDCDSGFYSDNFRCLKCVTGCRFCDGPSACNDCEDGFFLANGSCAESQCERDFLRGGRCKLCPVYCTQCSSDNNCSACVNDKYGETCMQSCSVLCLNNTCDDADGRCSFGCVEDYYGIQCEESSYHGINVSIYMLIIVILLAIVLVAAAAMYLARKRYFRRLEGFRWSGRTLQPDDGIPHEKQMDLLSDTQEKRTETKKAPSGQVKLISNIAEDTEPERVRKNEAMIFIEDTVKPALTTTCNTRLHVLDDNIFYYLK